LNKLLDETYGTEHYIDLMTRYELETENDRLLKLALDKSDEVVGRDAGALLLEQAGISYVTQKLAGMNDAKKSALLASIQTVGSSESVYLLRSTALNVDESVNVRKNAAKYLGASWPGEEAVVKLLRDDRLDGEVKEAALEGVKNAFREEIKAQLAPYFPKPKEEIKVVETPEEPKSKKEKRKRRRGN
jgi:hypothetical protein